MSLMKKSSEGVKTEFTAGEILGFMSQGAFYAALVCIGVAAFVIVFYVIGRLLPPEEAYFSSLETAIRALV